MFSKVHARRGVADFCHDGQRVRGLGGGYRFVKAYVAALIKLQPAAAPCVIDVRRIPCSGFDAVQAVSIYTWKRLK